MHLRERRHLACDFSNVMPNYHISLDVSLQRESVPPLVRGVTIQQEEQRQGSACLNIMYYVA